RAVLDDGLVARAGRPGRLGRVVRVRDRPRHVRGAGLVPAHRTHESLRSTSADVGTPLPLVTSAVSHDSSWFTDSPRSCRVASRIRFIPWTYASDRHPPAVFDGSDPPSTRSSPSAAYGPPSPGLTKPYSSSDITTSGENAS